MTNAIMLLASVLVCGAMVVIMVMFLRKLNRIEEEKWGKTKHDTF